MLSLLSGKTAARYLRLRRASVGPRVNIKPGLVIDNATGDQDATGDFRNLSIAAGCYIGQGVYFDLADRVTIGPQCAISAGVRFVTHQDCGARPMSTWYPRERAPVEVGSGSWLGVGAILLHGVTLGPCCVVAAGSVVRDSFPAFSVVAGSPARLVKTLDPDVAGMLHQWPE